MECKAYPCKGIADQNGGVGDPGLCSPTKITSYTGIREQKIALGELRSPLKELQQHGRTKHLRITAQKGKEDQLHLACITPSLRPALFGISDELPS